MDRLAGNFREEYRDLKTEIEQLVGKINGSFVDPGGWVPVWYAYRNLADESADYPMSF